MPYTMLDDKFHSHWKVEATSNEALGLYIRCLSWACDHLTDGFLPAGIVERRAGAKACKLAAELVQIGLWEVAETGPNGWKIHDFLDYNRPADVVKEERREISKKRADAGRKGARARWDRPHEGNDGKPDSKSMANGMAKAWQPDSKPMAPTLPYPTLPIPTIPPPTPPDGSSGVAMPDAVPVSAPGGGGGDSPIGLGLENPEALDPDELLRRYRAAFPDREPELSDALATAKGAVRSQAAYLRPAILRRLKGEDPAPLPTPTSSNGTNGTGKKHRTEAQQDRESAAAYRAFVPPKSDEKGEPSPPNSDAAARARKAIAELAEGKSADGPARQRPVAAAAPPQETPAERRERTEREEAALTEALARLEADPAALADLVAEIEQGMPDDLRERRDTAMYASTVRSQTRKRLLERIRSGDLARG